MTDMKPRVEIREYVVTCFPEDFEEASTWDIRVEYRGPNSWAVLSRSRSCLGADGSWDWEPSPSNREDDWKATHRFPLQRALELAMEAAPNVIVNGMTPAQAYAQWQQWQQDDAEERHRDYTP